MNRRKSRLHLTLGTSPCGSITNNHHLNLINRHQPKKRDHHGLVITVPVIGIGVQAKRTEIVDEIGGQAKSASTVLDESISG